MSGKATWQAEIKLDIEQLKLRLSEAEKELGNVTDKEHKVKLDIDTKTLDSAIKKLDKMLDSLGKGTGDFKQFEKLGNQLESITSDVKSLSNAFSKIDDSKLQGLFSSIKSIDDTLGKLSNHILNVGQSMQKVGSDNGIKNAVKNTQNLAKANEEAVKSAEKLANTQKNIGGSGSKFPSSNNVDNYKNIINDIRNYEKVQKRVIKGNGLENEVRVGISQLEEKIRSLQSQDLITEKQASNAKSRLNSVKSNLEDLEKTTRKSIEDSLTSTINTYQKKYDRYKSKPADGNQYTNYKEVLIEYASYIQKLKDLQKEISSGEGVISKDKFSLLDEYKQKIDSLDASIKSMSSSDKGASDISRWNVIQKISKYLRDNTNISEEAKTKLKEYLSVLKSGDPTANITDIYNAFQRVSEAERAAGREGKNFFSVIKDKVFYGAAASIASYFGINDIIQYSKQAVSAIVELDDELIDLKKTTSMNSSQLNEFYYDSNSMAKQMGVTTKEIINQAAGWSRLGYSTKETATEMAKLSSQFASISPGMSTENAQSGLVSIMKAWNIDPNEVKSEIMDPINLLGKIIAQTCSNAWCY